MHISLEKNIKVQELKFMKPFQLLLLEKTTFLIKYIASAWFQWSQHV